MIDPSQDVFYIDFRDGLALLAKEERVVVGNKKATRHHAAVMGETIETLTRTQAVQQVQDMTVLRQRPRTL